MKMNMPIYDQLVPVPREKLRVACSWMVPRGMGHALLHGVTAEQRKKYLAVP